MFSLLFLIRILNFVGSNSAATLLRNENSKEPRHSKQQKSRQKGLGPNFVNPGGGPRMSAACYKCKVKERGSGGYPADIHRSDL